MILGKVTARREAVVTISMVDKAGIQQPIDAVVDTGFTGELTLPSKFIEDLGLEFFGSRIATLADGSEVLLDNYLGDVIWHGKVRRIVVLESDGGPLVGMELLEGSDFSLRVTPGGLVTIEEFERHQ